MMTTLNSLSEPNSSPEKFNNQQAMVEIFKKSATYLENPTSCGPLEIPEIIKTILERLSSEINGLLNSIRQEDIIAGEKRLTNLADLLSRESDQRIAIEKFKLFKRKLKGNYQELFHQQFIPVKVNDQTGTDFSEAEEKLVLDEQNRSIERVRAMLRKAFGTDRTTRIYWLKEASQILSQVAELSDAQKRADLLIDLYQLLSG